MTDDFSNLTPAADAAVPEKPSKPKVPKEQSLVMGIIQAKIRGKKAYGKAKEYMDELKKLVKAGKAIELSDGRRFRVVDIFDGEQYAKKMTIIDRYELQEVK